MCYAKKEKAVVMADSLWTDISGNENNIDAERKVFEISIDVICGIAGNSMIYKVYDKLLCEFMFGAHFFDEVLEYIDLNREELCSLIPTGNVGCMIIAGFTDKSRSDIKVATLYFEHGSIKGKIECNEYPRIAIVLPPDIHEIKETDITKYVNDACGDVNIGIETLVYECIEKSKYCGGKIRSLSLPKW